MKLEHEFYRLPLRFDVECLTKELSAFSDSDWQKHPTDYSGNLAIPLISANGEINDTFSGPMLSTPCLARAPYMQQVMASFKSVLGRSRLMRLEGQHEVPRHSDINYHWYSRVRIHVPIVTTPDVAFHCGDRQVHMGCGEAWIFDSWKLHRVVNPSGSTRVHLVIDTAGSPEFWELVDRAEVNPPDHGSEATSEFIAYKQDLTTQLQIERYNFPLVMCPGELDGLIEGMIREARDHPNNNDAAFAPYIRFTDNFRHRWRSVWSLHGTDKTGWPEYARLIKEARQLAKGLPELLLDNYVDAARILSARILSAAFNPSLDPEFQAGMQQAEQQANVEKKIGRNDPCPCGSGKKYKRCHG